VSRGSVAPVDQMIPHMQTAFLQLPSSSLARGSLSWRAFLPRSHPRQCEWGFLVLFFVVIYKQRTTDNKPVCSMRKPRFCCCLWATVGSKPRKIFAAGAPGRPAALGGGERHQGTSPTILVHPVHPFLLAPPRIAPPLVILVHPPPSGASSLTRNTRNARCRSPPPPERN